MRDALERDALTVAEGQAPVMSFTLEQLRRRQILARPDLSGELDHTSILENRANSGEHADPLPSSPWFEPSLPPRLPEVGGKERQTATLDPEARVSITESATLHHTCYVVHDVEKTAAALAESGMGPWSIWTIEPVATTVRGRDVPYSFRIAFATVGGSSFELVAPHTGESIYVDHLETNGEGFHHTCIAYPSRVAMNEAKAELIGQGREVVQSAVVGEIGEFCYFHIAEIGSLLELLYLSELPPPEKTIG
jgi:Glyoxalase/Bleomycin resistance protein/Dioxygenase superfamily